MKSKFQFELDFQSMLLFGAVMGLAQGIVSLPFVLFANRSVADRPEFLLLLVLTPLIFLLNGALMALIGYPAYWWLCKKVIPLYSGKVKVRNEPVG